jgi:hypothetical protein
MNEFPIFVSLLVSAVAASVVLVYAIRGAKGATRLDPFAVFLIGGGLDWLLTPVYLLVYRLIGGISSLTFQSVLNAMTQNPGQKIFYWIENGIVWVLLYYCIRAVPLNSWRRRILAVLIVAIGSSFYHTLAYYFYLRVNHPDWTPEALSNNLQGLVGVQFSSGTGYSGFVFTAFQLWVISKWLQGSNQVWRTSDPIRAVGLKGVIMSKGQNQSTRLLCASVLFDSGARNKLLLWLKDKNRAVALELGLDINLAAQVARFAKKRASQGWLIYFAVFCLTALCSLLSGAALILGALVAGTVWFVRHKTERDNFVPMFWAETFNAEEVKKRFAAELEPDDFNALPSADQNFFVFGGFSPFVGAGEDLGGWSVVVALDRPRADFGEPAMVQPFTISEIYGAIDAGLEDLSVREIQKTDTFFARGTDLRGDPDLLPDIYSRPVQYLSPQVASKYIYRDDEKVRHYRCYRILDWGGELALSYFIRCSRRGNTLFVETKRFILTPLSDSHRAVDSMLPMEFTETIASFFSGLIAGSVFAMVSPLWMVGKALEKIGEVFSFNEDKTRREKIERTPLFNYGTVTSLRQSLSSGQYGHYFQKMDGDLYNKLFEHEVLDSLVEFLDDHNVDTSELKERQTTILNNGVMVQGGDVKAESLAVGSGARAVKKMKNLVASPATAGSRE